VRKSTVIIVLGFVVLFAYLLTATHGKECHVNVHLTKRLYCTEPAR
jgi:hypothetical protein